MLRVWLVGQHLLACDLKAACCLNYSSLLRSQGTPKQAAQDPQAIT